MECCALWICEACSAHTHPDGCSSPRSHTVEPANGGILLAGATEAISDRVCHACQYVHPCGKYPSPCTLAAAASSSWLPTLRSLWTATLHDLPRPQAPAGLQCRRATQATPSECAKIRLSFIKAPVSAFRRALQDCCHSRTLRTPATITRPSRTHQSSHRLCRRADRRRYRGKVHRGSWLILL